jgi:hypothetical protein
MVREKAKDLKHEAEETGRSRVCRCRMLHRVREDTANPVKGVS